MEDNSNNLDHNWSFPINLTGVRAPTGQDTALPEGYYQATISEMYINTSKNAGRVVIKLKVTDPPEFSGVVRTDGLNVPKSADDKVRHYWRGLAEACGYQPSHLDVGEMNLGPKAFVNKVVGFKFTPKSEADKYEDILYLAPAEWTKQKEAFKARPPSQVKGAEASNSGGATLGQEVAGSAGTLVDSSRNNGTATTGKNDVLNRLGLAGAGNNASGAPSLGN